MLNIVGPSRDSQRLQTKKCHDHAVNVSGGGSRGSAVAAAIGESQKSTTNTGSAASVKFMASHVRPIGSRNYVRQHQSEVVIEGPVNSASQRNCELEAHSYQPIASDPFLSSYPKPAAEGFQVVQSNEVSGLHPVGFKSQKDKRQKLDVLPSNVDLPKDHHRYDQSSCNIRTKVCRIDTIYSIHQVDALKLPGIVTRKSKTDVLTCTEVSHRERGAAPTFSESAVATASAGVRKFHGVENVPNISEEEGYAADWIGHAKSSTSQAVEVSVESTRGKDSTKKDDSHIPGNTSSNSPDAVEKTGGGRDWGGGCVDATEITTLTARGSNRPTSEMAQPIDSAISYRDQVVFSEVRNQRSSRLISTLTLRNECCSKLDEIIKNTAAVSHTNWPTESKRGGQFENVPLNADNLYMSSHFESLKFCQQGSLTVGMAIAKTEIMPRFR